MLPIAGAEATTDFSLWEDPTVPNCIPIDLLENSSGFVDVADVLEWKCPSFTVLFTGDGLMLFQGA